MRPFQSLGQRAHRIDACPVVVLGAELEHLHEPRLVQGRIGVGRAREARHPAGDGRLHLGFQGRHVFVAWLTQPRREVHQPRAHDVPGRFDDAVGRVARRRLADGDDPAGGDIHVPQRVHAVFRIDQPAAFDVDFHMSAARGVPSAHLIPD
jgi:hypothetical protein